MSTATDSIKAEVASPVEAPKAAASRGVAQERRRIMIVCAGLFVVLGAAILVAMTTNLPSALQPLGPRDLFGIEERNGSIVLKAENNRCRQIAFNNDTGAMKETSKPCYDRPAVVDKGVPVPDATIRRIDSIRQGFGK
jgi:hypothetical protein